MINKEMIGRETFLDEKGVVDLIQLSKKENCTEIIEFFYENLAIEDILQVIEDSEIRKGEYKVEDIPDYKTPTEFFFPKHSCPAGDVREEHKEEPRAHQKKPIDRVRGECEKVTGWKKISPYELYTIFEKEKKEGPITNQNQCSICLIELYSIIDSTSNLDDIITNTKNYHGDYEVIKMAHCSNHFFHKDCIQRMWDNISRGYIKCPLCSHIYGMLIGDMPGGTMTYYVDDMNHCEGYDYGTGTICIDYSIPNLKQKGIHIHGAHRIGYLPNNSEGRKMLQLLKEAFYRGLTFTIGTSTTTGYENTVTWNGIHHKTHLSGGEQRHGYPDPTYFPRLTDELALRGVKITQLTKTLQFETSKSLSKKPKGVVNYSPNI